MNFDPKEVAKKTSFLVDGGHIGFSAYQILVSDGGLLLVVLVCFFKNDFSGVFYFLLIT